MAEERTHHIILSGFVDPEFGLNLKNVTDQLRAKPKDQYDLLVAHVDSPGGDVFAGYAIYNLLNSFDKPIEFNILGMCGSIMTLIVGAKGKDAKVVMNKEVGQFMIHNAWSFACGDQNDLRKRADELDEIKEVILNVYEKRTGLGREKLTQMMDEETYMSPQEALDYGFVDETREMLRAVALDRYRNFKQKLTDNEMSQSNKFSVLMKDFFTKTAKILNGEDLPTPKSMLIALEDDTQLYIYTEDDEFVGKKVVLADEEGNPTDQAPPNGEHRLKDGRMITVQDGMITEIKEAAAEPAEEDGVSLEDRVSALEEKFDAKIEEFSNKLINGLKDELKNFEPTIANKVK